MKGKLVFGKGRYEKGDFKSYENGNITKIYIAWKSMLGRCYDPKRQAKQPTYIGCYVCPEWLEFQTFAQWYDDNYPKDGERYHLDKDLKALGNKVYSPEFCLFVSGGVNKFTNANQSQRGKLPIGVTFNKSVGMYISRCRNPINRKHEHLGVFTTELDAHLAWRKRKSELAYELAMTQTNPEVRDALLRWKLALDNNEIHKV